MELQTTFYIVGIVFMVLMILLFIALLAAVLVIKAKINKVHDMVIERVHQVKAMGDKLSFGLNVLKHFVRK